MVIILYKIVNNLIANNNSLPFARIIFFLFLELHEPSQHFQIRLLPILTELILNLVLQNDQEPHLLTCARIQTDQVNLSLSKEVFMPLVN
jgi:hypothetical protein